MNRFKVITISHKTANINLIGKYVPSFNADADKLAEKLREIKESLLVDELLYVSTCNRITFLLASNNDADMSLAIKLFQLLHPNAPADFCAELPAIVEIMHAEEAVRHIFEMAASLNSLVVGEREILRQLKAAYEFSDNKRLTGDFIRLLMKIVIPTAKNVYTHTKIGENSISVVALAMQRLAQEMKHLHLHRDARFLIIGAGQTNHLVAKFLLKNGFQHFTVFNRSHENAALLANKLRCESFTLDQLSGYNRPFDVLITCVGATDPVITTDLYNSLTQTEAPHTPKIIIDLAVPGNVEKKLVANNAHIKHIEVEELRTLAAENLALRQLEVTHAQDIIHAKMEDFKALCLQRKMELAMSDLPNQVKEIRERALGQVFQKEIAGLDTNTQQLLGKVLEYVEKKYIGIPMAMAKKISLELTNA